MEYVLVVAVVALGAIGALVYFGGTNAGLAHEIKTSGNAIALGAGPGPKAWCTNRESGCRVSVPIGGGATINFSATGGTKPYSFSLENAPRFLTLDSRDHTVLVEPRSCPPGSIGSYTYNGVTLLVTDSARPPGHGRLRFSVVVTSCGLSSKPS